MAFTEDLSVFLSEAEFAVPVVSGEQTGSGILDMPTDIISDGVILTR